MSQETTQDLSQSLPETKDNLQNSEADLQEDFQDSSGCIATLYFEGVEDERKEFALYPEEEIRVGREFHLEPSTYKNSMKNLKIRDARVSKNHFRIYSIIYEQKRSHDTETSELPPLIYCEDLESSNGTWINSVLIGIMGKERIAHLLCDGDVIEIRPSWKFTFHQSNHRILCPTSPQSRDMEFFRDRYSISGRILGSGQFGNVYLATEVSLNKQIACKVVDLHSAMRSVLKNRTGVSATGLGWKSRLDSARKQKKKVLLEIEILSKLNHPNIINLRKAFCSDSALYIFTDLAPAGDLFSYTQSHGGYLGDYNSRVITLQVTLAIEYLHSHGITHRDIKQENVLITTTDFGGRVLLTDFGFATYVHVKSGRMLSKVGTEGFVAPEVENVGKMSSGYTKAADMWSLGVLTASLLTGDLTIPHEQLFQLSQVHIADRFLGVDDSYTRHHWVNMPPRALNFIRRLLVAEPEERMTAAEAIHHSWYTKPASEAAALVDGLQRIQMFWKQREISSDEVLETLPSVVTFASSVSGKSIPKFQKKIPDTTNSPYFGLDRHLIRKMPSGRKRLLDDLNESGYPFVTSQTPQHPIVASNIALERDKGLERVTSVDGTDLFKMSPSGNKKELLSEIEIIDLISTTHMPEPQSNNNDTDRLQTAHLRHFEKQLRSDLGPNTPESSPWTNPVSDRCMLDSKRSKKGNPRYTFERR